MAVAESHWSFTSKDFEEVAFQENGSSLSLRGYRHAAHCTLHSVWESYALGSYETRAAVLMQIRFDGCLGFPGGMISSGEKCIDGLNRELAEELNLDLNKYKIKESDHIFSHICKSKRLILHFYAKEISLEAFRDIEVNALHAPDYNDEVFGNCRVPLYTTESGYGGFPAFLNNNFIGNAKQQLLLTLHTKAILTEDEIKKAVKRAKKSRKES